MKKRYLVAAVVFVMLLNACAPVMVGSHYVRSGKESELIKEFTEKLRADNLEREKAGLKPLDFCEEAKYQSERLQKQLLKNCDED